MKQRLPEDEAVAQTLEDSSCLLIQKRIRGNAGRKYAAWYKRKIQEVRLVRCAFFGWWYKKKALVMHAVLVPCASGSLRKQAHAHML